MFGAYFIRINSLIVGRKNTEEELPTPLTLSFLGDGNIWSTIG